MVLCASCGADHERLACRCSSARRTITRPIDCATVSSDSRPMPGCCRRRGSCLRRLHESLESAQLRTTTRVQACAHRKHTAPCNTLLNDKTKQICIHHACCNSMSSSLVSLRGARNPIERRVLLMPAVAARWSAAKRLHCLRHCGGEFAPPTSAYGGTRQSDIPLMPINTATPTPRACVCACVRAFRRIIASRTRLLSRCRSLIWHVCRIPPEQHPCTPIALFQPSRH